MSAESSDQFGRFRDECLNEHIFTTLGVIRPIVADWLDDYNAERPHTSLGDITPNEYENAISYQKPYLAMA